MIDEDLEDFSVIEIKKFKMVDLHADLEEACMKIKKFEVIGNAGREVMSNGKIKPGLKKYIRNEMVKDPVHKPVIINVRTPMAQRLRQRNPAAH